jgi:hypothetical protein
MNTKTKVSFEGVGEQVLSFYNNGSEDGQPVGMSDSCTVTACSDGDKFIGVCIRHTESHATVKTSGYVELGCSGQLPAVGFAYLAADGNGGVKTVSGGREYLVISVDSENSRIGFMM